MKDILLFLSLIILLAGCKSDSNSTNQSTNKPADVNFYLQTDVKIDSVLFANFTQDREFQFMPYSDTLNITLNDSINDSYFIKFYTGNNAIMYPMWLDGKNLIIKGKITDKFRPDTVIGSSLYYYSLDFRKKYKALVAQAASTDSMNSFLFRQLQANISSPFSIEISSFLYQRNISNKAVLRKLYDLLAAQPEAIKQSLNNPYKGIEKVLTVNKIALQDFQFYNTDDKLTTISPAKGKKYLLDFWFIECAPCLADHKIMAGKRELLNSSKVELIGISIDQGQAEWKNFIRQKNYYWQNLREVDDPEKNLRTNLLITAFPTYLLLDGEGNILQRSNSFADIEKYL
jgi:thiol-disulfide isomerase/thioredoxin